jgi:hypothetical protein
MAFIVEKKNDYIPAPEAAIAPSSATFKTWER